MSGMSGEKPAQHAARRYRAGSCVLGAERGEAEAARSTRLAARSTPWGEPCRLCGGRSFEPVRRGCRDRRLNTPGVFAIVRCRACGLMRTHPWPGGPADAGRLALTPAPGVPCAGCWVLSGEKPRQHAARGTQHSLARAAAWAPYRLRYGRADALPPPWPGAGRALDIGCGRGALLAHLRELGWDVWGIEPDAEAAAAAERAVGRPGRIIRERAERVDYPPAFFDLITLMHSLEHLEEPLMVLTRARRWLRPGGVLRVRVPDIASAEARLFGRLWDGLDVPRHRHHFTARTLTLLCERAGFVVQRRVPEAQATLLAGSLAALVHPSGLPGRAARALYLFTVPLAAALAALGMGGSIDVTAVPRP